ncbi:MAG: formate dehydrogenase subunit delta [Gammaproteobacteria bacterium]|nr:formate dehydrogenase subunit delta [Gammaproteobacteria bacterium]
MTTNRFVHMANQVAAFFDAYPEAEAVEAVVAHIRQFWDPRMRNALVAQLNTGGEGLSPLALSAARRLDASRAPRTDRA